ncbi:regulatory protein GemA [Pseudorhodobacter sp. E13]|uniref:regulatory protein GemA n=1 Tax=Pseudorhodobacter sp. E13 TaxID=2487931 RepID=UPI000F8E6B4C|nr:regulatory protein GemA [Pseudorhodobacter sp. E13]RUS64895.1 regulatory protein GemA [Pseudorhodobacter sp. E13]
MTLALKKLIHVGARELGLDADTRHDLQLVATGKASLADMTEAELEKVVAAMKARGFKPSGGRATNGRRAAAPRADLRFCHLLWGKLHRAGAVDAKGAAGLNGFIRKRFGDAWGAAPLDIDQMRDWKQIATVIEALKAMCKRVGVDLDA